MDIKHIVAVSKRKRTCHRAHVDNNYFVAIRKNASATEGTLKLTLP